MQIGDTIPREMRSGVGSRLQSTLYKSIWKKYIYTVYMHKYPLISDIKWSTALGSRVFVLLVLPASVSLRTMWFVLQIEHFRIIQYDRTLTQLLSKDFVECHFSHFSEMFVHHAPNAEI